MVRSIAHKGVPFPCQVQADPWQALAQVWEEWGGRTKAPQWKRTAEAKPVLGLPSFFSSLCGIPKARERERGPVKSFISPLPLGTAHLTGKVSPSVSPPVGRTDAAIARQIAREGFRGFLLLWSSLIPWSCGAKPRDGPNDRCSQKAFS